MTQYDPDRRCQGYRVRKLDKAPVLAVKRSRGERLSPEQQAAILEALAAGVKTRELVLCFYVTDVTIGKLRRLVA